VPFIVCSLCFILPLRVVPGFAFGCGWCAIACSGLPWCWRVVACRCSSCAFTLFVCSLDGCGTGACCLPGRACRWFCAANFMPCSCVESLTGLLFCVPSMDSLPSCSSFCFVVVGLLCLRCYLFTDLYRCWITCLGYYGCCSSVDLVAPSTTVLYTVAVTVTICGLWVCSVPFSLVRLVDSGAVAYGCLRCSCLCTCVAFIRCCCAAFPLRCALLPAVFLPLRVQRFVLPIVCRCWFMIGC